MDTRTIEIRHAEPEDYRALRRLFCQPAAVAGTLQLPFPSLELWRRRLSEPPDGLYALVACVSDEVVGSAGLTVKTRTARRRHVGEVGIAVRDDWQRRGVGSALLGAIIDLADNWIGLRRLELTVFTDNAGAIRLYERFGFEMEGTLRSYALRAGAFVDAHAMARLR